MMYDAYQGLADVGDRVRLLAANAQVILEAWSSQPFASPWRKMAAYCELVALAGFTHARPDWEVDVVEVGGREFAISQGVAAATPFCELRHFRKEGGGDDPKVLLVAPMSGHFATLLRGALRTLLHDHQVYVTDWINPRNVKPEAGGFGLDDYTQHSDRFRPPYRRRLPHRRRLPADGQRADRRPRCSQPRAASSLRA